jgi:hypothetical protein
MSNKREATIYWCGVGHSMRAICTIRKYCADPQKYRKIDSGQCIFVIVVAHI